MTAASFLLAAAAEVFTSTGTTCPAEVASSLSIRPRTRTPPPASNSNGSSTAAVVYSSRVDERHLRNVSAISTIVSAPRSANHPRDRVSASARRRTVERIVSSSIPPSTAWVRACTADPRTSGAADPASEESPPTDCRNHRSGHSSRAPNPDGESTATGRSGVSGVSGASVEGSVAPNHVRGSASPTPASRRPASRPAAWRASAGSVDGSWSAARRSTARCGRENTVGAWRDGPTGAPGDATAVAVVARSAISSMKREGATSPSSGDSTAVTSRCSLAREHAT